MDFTSITLKAAAVLSISRFSYTLVRHNLVSKRARMKIKILNYWQMVLCIASAIGIERLHFSAWFKGKECTQTWKIWPNFLSAFARSRSTFLDTAGSSKTCVHAPNISFPFNLNDVIYTISRTRVIKPLSCTIYKMLDEVFLTIDTTSITNNALYDLPAI